MLSVRAPRPGRGRRCTIGAGSQPGSKKTVCTSRMLPGGTVRQTAADSQTGPPVAESRVKSTKAWVAQPAINWRAGHMSQGADGVQAPVSAESVQADVDEIKERTRR